MQGLAGPTQKMNGKYHEMNGKYHYMNEQISQWDLHSIIRQNCLCLACTLQTFLVIKNMKQTFSYQTTYLKLISSLCLGRPIRFFAVCKQLACVYMLSVSGCLRLSEDGLKISLDHETTSSKWNNVEIIHFPVLSVL